MATIRKQSTLILQHPYYKVAVEQASAGDNSGMERIFYEVMAHLWEKCSLESSRVYGKFHRLNHMDIKRELRDQAPPETLDLKLPTPHPLRGYKIRATRTGRDGLYDE